MSPTLVDKFLRIIGFEDEVVEEEISFEPPSEVEPAERPRKGKVISLHNQGRMRVVVVEPTSFDDAKRVVDHLKGKQAVVLNLEDTEGAVAQRIIDFVSGATFAINGGIQRVGQGIFLFTPNNVDIAAELKETRIEDSLFPWANKQDRGLR